MLNKAFFVVGYLVIRISVDAAVVVCTLVRMTVRDVDPRRRTIMEGKKDKKGYLVEKITHLSETIRDKCPGLAWEVQVGNEETGYVKYSEGRGIHRSERLLAEEGIRDIVLILDQLPDLLREVTRQYQDQMSLDRVIEEAQKALD